MAVAHAWVCICGRDWGSQVHLDKLALTGGRWRGQPYALDPWDQWFRENMPQGHKGIVRNGDDGIVRTHDPGKPDGAGAWALVEAKSRMAEPTFADECTLRVVSRGVALRPLLVRFDGDVPTFLRHWPKPCGDCGAPGPVPRPSTLVVVQIFGGYREPRKTKRIEPEALRGELLRYVQHQPR